jgi:hypothetical protein
MYGIEGVTGVGVGAKKLVGNGVFDIQHGTGVEGSSHTCTKVYYLK